MLEICQILARQLTRWLRTVAKYSKKKKKDSTLSHHALKSQLCLLIRSDWLRDMELNSSFHQVNLSKVTIAQNLLTWTELFNSCTLFAKGVILTRLYGPWNHTGPKTATYSLTYAKVHSISRRLLAKRLSKVLASRHGLICCSVSKCTLYDKAIYENS